MIDLGRVRANIARAQGLADAHGVALRPHVKTHKLPEIARLQLDAGAVGIQVAKLGEAEVMVEAGIDDILVGYPIVGSTKLDRLGDLAERARIRVSIDSVAVARGLSDLARERGLELEVLIELDTGLRRLGVLPGAPAVELAQRIAELPGVVVRGVLTHEGHVYTQARTLEEKESLTHKACGSAVETAAMLREQGLPADVVSVGSAGTLRFAVRCPGVTEVRPGTYVFNDRSQIAQGAATNGDLAARIVTTIVSRPTPERIVVDAGSKTLAADRMIVPDPPPSFGIVEGHDDWVVARLSEEHGVIELPAAAEARVGDRIAIVPNHVCPTINLAEHVTVVDDGALLGRWPVAARGRVR